MDDFLSEQPELTGSLISLEFGAAGRILQLWASDPNLPEEGDEFQFVLPPITFGEEFAEDYYPGTVLLGARTNPNEPWALARNTAAEIAFSEDDLHGVTFDYDFSLLPEVAARGRFYEIPAVIPQIAWDFTIRNRGRKSLEIGELAFPFAFNNLYEGFGRNQSGDKSVWHDRVYIHKFIGGAASHLFVQRLNAEPPGLLVFPGDDTNWEFITHAPASLTAPFRWEGVPIVYIYSRAALEREGWAPWANEHTSLILEPGDQRTFQTRFVPSERDRQDHVYSTLAVCKRPAIKVLPSAVAPTDVGIALEIGGATPARFYASKDVAFETDADEDGGFCFVKPKSPGPLRVSFEDTQGRLSHAHLLFVEPISKLIEKRAEWIVKHQLVHDKGSSLDRAILVADIRTGQRMSGDEEVGSSFAIEGGLADALFLAEKNTIYPDRAEIKLLDQYVDDFLRDDLQNPGDDTVGSAFTDSRSVALNYGRPQIYPLVYSLYQALYRVAGTYGSTAREPKDYLRFAARTAIAMYKRGIPRQVRNVGLAGNARVFDLMDDLQKEGMLDEVDELTPLIHGRAEDLLRRKHPYAEDHTWNSFGFAEAFSAARYLTDDEHLERALRYANAARSLSPSWWWYGSDIRQWDPEEGLPHSALMDCGELCLGGSTTANSLVFFSTLDSDYGQISESYMRQAFGGLMGVWALVRPDGAASMGYCPDPASRHYGFNALTGDVGVSLFNYLRGAGAYVMPSRTYGVFTFGCHFEVEEDCYVVRPWDGIGRRVILRQIGAEFTTSFGIIEELRLDVRKRWAEIVLRNPADLPIDLILNVRGLWGEKFDVMGSELALQDGTLAVRSTVPSLGVVRIKIKVKS